MNWDALGTIAEVIGAAGVVVSLLYLGAQIREQNRQSRLESVSESTRQWNEILADTANNQILCSIWIRGLEDFDELERTERAQFSSHLGRVCRVVEGLHEHFTEKRLKPEAWEALHRTLVDLAAYPGFSAWWVTRSEWYGVAFQEYIGSILASPSTRPAAYGGNRETPT